MPVADTPAHPITKRASDAPYGCYNRPPFSKVYRVPNGYAEDGRMQFVNVPHVLSTCCMTGKLDDDPRCRDCLWKEPKNAAEGGMARQS